MFTAAFLYRNAPSAAAISSRRFPPQPIIPWRVESSPKVLISMIPAILDDGRRGFTIENGDGEVTPFSERTRSTTQSMDPLRRCKYDTTYTCAQTPVLRSRVFNFLSRLPSPRIERWRWRLGAGSLCKRQAFVDVI
jgi:hypothetical protein